MKGKLKERENTNPIEEYRIPTYKKRKRILKASSHKKENPEVLSYKKENPEASSYKKENTELTYKKEKNSIAMSETKECRSVILQESTDLPKKEKGSNALQKKGLLTDKKKNKTALKNELGYYWTQDFGFGGRTWTPDFGFEECTRILLDSRFRFWSKK
ncbi:unnamed protein product [Rhizophagus irregularis]|nr:unnamed protein product [Rhizophagus irregularis]